MMMIDDDEPMYADDVTFHEPMPMIIDDASIDVADWFLGAGDEPDCRPPNTKWWRKTFPRWRGRLAAFRRFPRDFPWCGWPASDDGFRCFSMIFSWWLMCQLTPITISKYLIISRAIFFTFFMLMWVAVRGQIFSYFDWYVGFISFLDVSAAF